MAADCLILASTSKYRAVILQNAGLNFSQEAANINERAIEDAYLQDNQQLAHSKKTTSAKNIASILAEAKANDVSLRFPTALIIGCDQTLECEGKIFHKAANMEEARRRLLALSNKTHHLHSAIALYKNGNKIWSDCATADMTMRALQPDFIGRYLAKMDNKILSSVGAYQIEGEGVQLFEKIEGDYFTIIGLPLLLLLKKLRALGVIDG